MFLVLNTLGKVLQKIKLMRLSYLHGNGNDLAEINLVLGKLNELAKWIGRVAEWIYVIDYIAHYGSAAVLPLYLTRIMDSFLLDRYVEWSQEVQRFYKS